MLTLLALVVLGASLLLIERAQHTGSPLRAPTQAGAPAHPHDAPLADVPPAGRAPEPSAAEPKDFGRERFAGRGRVRGEIGTAPGIAFPLTWTLVIEPHPWLVGSEHATLKRVDMTRGERTFDVGDLSLGGYRVRAEAPGLNSTDASVLLVKGSDNPYVTLELRPSGMIDGRVLAADGSPAEGLEVVLEPRKTLVRVRTQVDANGSFVFRDVLDGEYRLFLGPPDAPLFAPADIVFSAPTLRYPEQTLPPTGTLRVTTADENGLAVSNVEVTGFGSPKGALRVTTGADGVAVVRWLQPGMYRLEAKSADGRRAKDTFEVRPGQANELRMHLRNG